MYFSFDEEVADFDELMQTYQREILREDFFRSEQPCYLFFDEILLDRRDLQESVFPSLVNNPIP